MTVGELIEALKQYPPHFRVSLCQVISVGGGAGFDEVLDSPIIGAAGHPAGDVRFVTTRDGNGEHRAVVEHLERRHLFGDRPGEDPRPAMSAVRGP